MACVMQNVKIIDFFVPPIENFNYDALGMDEQQ